MDHWHIRQLDQWRDIVLKSCSFTITADYANEGHSPDSYHYKGQAVDGYISFGGKRLSAVDQFILAMRSPFHGIGIYTWSPNGCFLDLDSRATFEGKVWACGEKGEYKNLNESFFRRMSTI